jgi:predicted DNA-binding protein
MLIEVHLYTELEPISRTTGQSKSALVREFIRRQIRSLPPFDEDPLFRLAGARRSGRRSPV